MDAHLEFRMLGGFSVAWNGKEIMSEAWGRRRAAALLKAVIGEPGTRCPADLLVERLWPESTPAAGRTNLRVKLHEVRSTLAEFAPAGLDLTKHPPVRFDGGVVSIDALYGPWIDALEFERAAVAALDADGEPREVAQRCAEALRSWGGEYLPADRDDAILVTRERFARLHRALLLRAAQGWQRCGEDEREIQLLEQAFEAYPQDEQIAALLIGRQAARARRERVREVYERHTKALGDRTGLAPSERLQRLAGFAVSSDGASNHTGRLRAPIVGRGEELALCADLLDRTSAGGARVLAVCGAQGVGKSRLLAEIAQMGYERHMRVGHARCFCDPRAEHSGLDTVSVLSQLIRSIDDGPHGEHAILTLLEAAEDGEEPVSIVARFRRMLREICRGDAVLLVVDDAHLAPASAFPYLYTWPQAGEERMPLVIAFRSPASHELASMRGVTLLDLAPLARASCADVVTQAFDAPPSPELAQMLVELWPGDLGIIMAAAQHAQLAGLAVRDGRRWVLLPGTQSAALIPEIARRMVMHRIGQLGSIAAEVLKAIAYAGPRVELSIVAVMLDRDAAAVNHAVRELVQAGLATLEGSRVDAPLAVRLISAAGVSMRRQSMFVERLADALTRAYAGRG